MSLIRRFAKEESAATMVEYGVMVALVAAVAIAVVVTLGQDVRQAFQSVETAMPGGGA